MSIGMSYHDFWHLNTSAHKAYRDAYKIKLHNDEWDRWRRGAYVYTAILRLSPVLRASWGKGKLEPEKYLEQPWPLTEKEAEEREEAERKMRFDRFLRQLESESKEVK